MAIDPSFMQKLMPLITQDAVTYSVHIIGGCVILIASWVLSNFAARLVQRTIDANKIDVSIIKFLAQAARMAILALGVLMTLSSFGVQIAPLVAGLSVAGVGAGLALQGPLSNYASGAALIFTKPFKVGDIIEVKGHQGEVRDISLPRTELFGLDGSTIVIPNKHIIGEVVKNFSATRSLEINVGVSYDSDVNKALAVMEGIIKAEGRIPNKEGYALGIKEFADSAVNLQAFVRVPQAKYAAVKFAVNKAILDQFRAQGIVIPNPQRDVHIYQK